jgi:restriction system protein
MGRRTSPIEDLARLASLLPWWLSLLLAAASWFVLSAYAGSEVAVNPENPFESVSGAIPRALATVGQFVLPLAFFSGAVWSLGRSLRNGRLLNRVTSPVQMQSGRYHGQDLDPMLTLSWQEFEHLVGEIFRRRGYSVVETGKGADGGVDLVARKEGRTVLIQCKHWRTRDVGVSIVRELLGAVAARRASGGVVVTVGGFTEEARRFAREAQVELIDGDALRRLAHKVGNAPHRPASQAAGDPIDKSLVCPMCQSPMVKRVARRGVNKGQAFLGCTRFPDCRATRPL